MSFGREFKRRKARELAKRHEKVSKQRAKLRRESKRRLSSVQAGIAFPSVSGGTNPPSVSVAGKDRLAELLTTPILDV